MEQGKIGTIVQSRRVFLALKQEDLAEMAGVSSRTIYSLEQGKGNPSLDTLQKIFEVLGLEIEVNIKSVDA